MRESLYLYMPEKTRDKGNSTEPALIELQFLSFAIIRPCNIYDNYYIKSFTFITLCNKLALLHSVARLQGKKKRGFHMKQITDSEMIIMKIIWGAKGMVTSSYVQEHLAADIKWKTTTVTTFLSRLTARGMIRVEQRQGRMNFFLPVMCEEEYSEKAMREVMQGSGLSSVKNLIASLYQSNDISSKDIAALKDWVQEAGYDQDHH